MPHDQVEEGRCLNRTGAVTAMKKEKQFWRSSRSTALLDILCHVDPDFTTVLSMLVFLGSDFELASAVSVMSIEQRRVGLIFEVFLEVIYLCALDWHQINLVSPITKVRMLVPVLLFTEMGPWLQVCAEAPSPTSITTESNRSKERAPNEVKPTDLQGFNRTCWKTASICFQL